MNYNKWVNILFKIFMFFLWAFTIFMMIFSTMVAIGFDIFPSDPLYTESTTPELKMYYHFSDEDIRVFHLFSSWSAMLYLIYLILSIIFLIDTYRQYNITSVIYNLIKRYLSLNIPIELIRYVVTCIVFAFFCVILIILAHVNVYLIKEILRAIGLSKLIIQDVFDVYLSAVGIGFVYLAYLHYWLIRRVYQLLFRLVRYIRKVSF